MNKPSLVYVILSKDVTSGAGRNEIFIMGTAAVAAAGDEPEDDDSLMRRAAQGDTEAFGRIVRAYQHRVQSFAARILGGDDTAGDVAQETFLRLWSTRATYQPRDCLLPYLFQIARNLCYDMRRREARQAAAGELLERLIESPPADSRLREIALAEMVSAALAELPIEQCETFVLSHYECLSYREIAGILDCPIGTVASRKYLAVEALRRRLKAWIEE